MGREDKSAYHVQLEYGFDRLSKRKLAQAYKWLVPEQTRPVVTKGPKTGKGDPVTEESNENGGDLYTSLFGEAKGGTHD